MLLQDLAANPFQEFSGWLGIYPSSKMASTSICLRSPPGGRAVEENACRENRTRVASVLYTQRHRHRPLYRHCTLFMAFSRMSAVHRIKWVDGRSRQTSGFIDLPPLYPFSDASHPALALYDKSDKASTPFSWTNPSSVVYLRSRHLFTAIQGGLGPSLIDILGRTVLWVLVALDLTL